MSRETSSCSFCEKTIEEVNSIIQGPQAHICNECVDTCGEVLSGTAVPDWATTAEEQCGFCNRDASAEMRIIGNQTTAARICNECVKLCVEVLKEAQKQSGQE